MFDPDRLISARARSIDASGIRRVFDLAQQVKNPINLSIGQPDFDVPNEAKRAAIDAIEKGPNSYTVTQGTAALRDAVAGEFRDRFAHDERWNDFGTLITSGVSGGLMLAMLACVGPGDRVLMPDPYFVMYKHLVRMAGGEPVFVDTYPDFRLTAERVAPLIDTRTKLLIVSSPSNPTGVVLNDDDWSDLINLTDKHGVMIVSDEIYDVFCYEPVDTPVGPRCPSPASQSDHVLVLRGFSKTYGMTGWRLGYAIGPKAVVDQMTKLQQYTFVCAPSMVQQAGIAALSLDMSEHVTAYRRKRDRVIERLSPVFDLTVPGGAFYAFPHAPKNETGDAFVERAIARGVLIIPGSDFSERKTHFRISYACDDAMLERGLDALLELAAK